MKFLDETIYASVATSQEVGRGTFVIQWRANSAGTSTDIYHGILYLSGTATLQVDVTDILASIRHDWDILLGTRANGTEIITDWIGEYRMQVTFGSTTYTGTWAYAALIYRNPETLNGFGDNVVSATLRQGGLTPHVPYIQKDSNYSSKLSLVKSADGFVITYNTYLQPWNAGTFIIDGTVSNPCYSRYYLRWIDRWGGFQQQPFDGKIVHSEDIGRTNIQNTQGVRRMVQTEVTPKWQLNTQWLDEATMPVWESLFVSPYAALYDTRLDKVFPVLITEKSYTHKTYKNNKLFNLTVQVEGAKKQNIRN